MDHLSIIPNKHKFLQIIENIAKVPKILYFKGTLPSERIPAVAIVGTRKPTPYGKEVTYQLAFELAKRGIVIISGLAYGIDAIAHQAALDAGGTTIAVLGNGIDSVYPTRHQRLAQNILANGGAVISEYPPGVPAQKYSFLARNRIVSGLSDAVIVTEAAARSGTLSTVNHALEQGKEIFAVPGNITSPMSEGCNTIIKQGAIPLTHAQEVIDLIAPELSAQTIRTVETHPILTLIRQGIHSGEELLARSGLETSHFLQELTLLEIRGAIRPLGNNHWTT